MLLTFPDSRQSQSFSCGAAATQAVLYYYGIEHREDQIIEALDSNDQQGTPPGNIVRALLGAGLSIFAGRTTIADVKRHLDQGHPTILAIQAWGEPGDYAHQNKDGHYVVAIGHQDGSIIFDDPSLLSNRGYITESELDQRWHDLAGNGMYLDHFGIVASGTPKYDPKRILSIRASRVASRWLSHNYA